jgi:hypothetical protein
MGMPINSFSIMRTICQGGDTYMVKAVKKLLDEFKLFAIIIHDPNLHRDLDRHIASQFDHLDYITGKDLLFFPLLKHLAIGDAMLLKGNIIKIGRTKALLTLESHNYLTR